MFDNALKWSVKAANLMSHPARWLISMTSPALALVVAPVLVVVWGGYDQAAQDAASRRKAEKLVGRDAQATLLGIGRRLRAGQLTYREVTNDSLSGSTTKRIQTEYRPGALMIFMTGYDRLAQGWFGTVVSACYRGTIGLPVPRVLAAAQVIPCAEIPVGD